MKRKLTALMFSLCLMAGAMATAYAATCTTKVTLDDGTKTEVTLEGDYCKVDFNTGICACI